MKTPGPIRLVLDANVLVSSQMRPSGSPGLLLTRRCADPSCVMVSSDAILAELRRALRYPKVVRYTGQTSDDTERVVTAIGMLSEMIEGPLPQVKQCADPDDTVYVQVAVAGQASFLVSGDKHLLAMDGYEGLRIVKPTEMLRILDDPERVWP